jgi:hypothetical protein
MHRANTETGDVGACKKNDGIGKTQLDKENGLTGFRFGQKPEFKRKSFHHCLKRETDQGPQG